MSNISFWIAQRYNSFNYINWDVSEPQNYMGDVISIDTTSGKWRVDFESNQRGVACKKAVGGAGVSSCGNGCYQEDICEVRLFIKFN